MARNPFAGADDVYLTENSIAVRRVSTGPIKNGRYQVKDKTTYYPKTKKNLDLAHRKHGHIRFGRR